MALELLFESEQGINCKYHRIEDVKFNKKTKCKVTIMSYIDETCAKTDKFPVCCKEFDQLEIGDLQSLYLQLKEKDFWKQAKDI